MVALGNIITGSRCSNNIKKHNSPTQAWTPWNKMSVAAIPAEIDDLSEIEKNFVCSVVYFLKIRKVQNRFSQDWGNGCKGEVYTQEIDRTKAHSS